MRIGLTFDLREEYRAAGYSDLETAEMDDAETIDALDAALRALGADVARIGSARSLARRLLGGERWDLVFNLCEGLHGYGRESLVPALLDDWRIPYVFSDPLSCALTLHKAMAKHVLRSHGIPTADFALVADEADVDRVDLPFPVFAKPVAEGTGKGIAASSHVGDRAALADLCRKLLRMYHQPVLVETWLPGREFTVGMVGTAWSARVLGVMEVKFGSRADGAIYTYDNKANWRDRIEYSVPEEPELVCSVEDCALRAWRALGCRDGGRIDIRLDATGAPAVIEVNPLAGLHPGHSDLPFIARFNGLSYEELIGLIVHSALERIGSDAVGGCER